MRYRHCCKGQYGPAGYTKARALISKGEFRKALPELRKHLTWYRLSHLAHTAQLLPAGNPAILHLLDIDIRAMFDITDRLMLCYHEIGVSGDFLGVLDELKEAIDDPRWFAKVTYFKALHLSNYKSRASAWAVVEKSRLLSVLEDEHLLGIAIEASPVSYPVADRIMLIDRLIANTEDVDVKFNYKSLKGVLTFLDLDDASGADYLVAALEEYEKVPLEKRSLFGQLRVGGFYAFAARIAGRSDLDDHAIRQFQICLKNPGYTSGARAEILRDCGECFLCQGEWDQAIACFDASMLEVKSTLTSIYKTRALVLKKDFNGAGELLSSIDVRNLNSAGQLDFGIAWAELALATQNGAQKQDALDFLKKLVYRRGYFERIRVDLISALKIKNSPNPSKPSLYRRIFTRYAILQPNINGFGINLNAIIKDKFPENPNS